jgi:hypothetical protein
MAFLKLRITDCGLRIKEIVMFKKMSLKIFYKESVIRNPQSVM